MDAFHLTVTGRVSKIFGLRTDRYDRQQFSFSMACNRVVGGSQEALFLTVNVPDPLLNIVVERGVYVGENLLVMTDFAQLNATMRGNVAKGWLNITARQLIFLSNERPPALEREAGLLDRSDNIIDYNLLMKLKSERVG